MSTTLFDTEMRDAIFSDCGKYRYALWRIWDEAKPHVMFIGINPSTANYDTDDPTIESVRRISITNGYGGFYMMNLYGIISSKTSIFKQKDIDHMGENLEWHSKIRERVKDVVFAWGGFKEAKEMSVHFIAAYPSALCIGKNSNGSPKHPLFQKGNSKLIKF